MTLNKLLLKEDSPGTMESSSDSSLEIGVPDFSPEAPANEGREG